MATFNLDYFAVFKHEDVFITSVYGNRIIFDILYIYIYI